MRLGVVVVLCVAAPLAGCTSYSGHSGTCRYGLKGLNSGGNHCFSRPQPSDALVAKAMSTEPLARALRAWKRGHGSAVASSVGINRWAETTFAVQTATTGPNEFTLTTFDGDGKTTSGNDGYACHPEDPFRVSDVDPGALGRVIRAIRADRPETTLLAAILTEDPFADELTWHVTVISSNTSSSLSYLATPDGSDICHGRDDVEDALRPAPEIPPCAHSVLSLYSGT